MAIDNKFLFLLSLEILLKPNKLHKKDDLSSSLVFDVISNTTLEYSFCLNSSVVSNSNFWIRTIGKFKRDNS